MNKVIYGIAAATVLIPTVALASPGDDGCVGNCPQEGGSGGPVEVSNVNENSNDSTAIAGAIAGSSSDSSATGVGYGGSSTVGVAVTSGPTVSGSVSNASGGKGGDGGDAYASGGDAYASGGDADSRSYSEGGDVGDTTAIAGPSISGASVGDTATGDVSSSIGVSVDASDNSSYSVEYEEAAARAATVYTQVCMNGGSAQGVAGGFSINNQDVVCEHLKVAAVLRDAYVFEMKYGTYESCENEMVGEEQLVTCTNEQAEFYRKAYHEHMTEAIQAMEMYEEVGLLDKMAGALVRPMALIGALIWLI